MLESIVIVIGLLFLLLVLAGPVLIGLATICALIVGAEPEREDADDELVPECRAIIQEIHHGDTENTES